MECAIRKWEIEDAKNLAKVLNNKKVQENLRDGLPYPYKEDDAKEFITAMLQDDTNFAFAITVDGVAIGSISVFRQENIHYRTAEMGYCVDEKYWHQGIATQAIQQTCQYVCNHSDIVRIFATPFAYNTASCRALEKSGFIYEGTLKKNAVKNGQILDMKMYAFVKEDI